MSTTTSIDPLLLLTIRLGRLVTNKMHQQLGKEDQHLMGPHMGILADLCQQDGVRQQDLATSSLKDKATITRSVNFLEQEGLVMRTPDPTDRRTKRIYITTKGRQVYQKMLPLGHTILAQAKQDIGAEELAICQRVLQKMYNNLNQ
ncbi:MAG: MarR family transcriptional regulator [Bacteroidota bacterium]